MRSLCANAAAASLLVALAAPAGLAACKQGGVSDAADATPSAGGADGAPAVDPTDAACGARCEPGEVPRLGHVFVILMENTSFSRLAASTNTPYLHQLMADGAVLSNYHGVRHPSLPNYLALVSGGTQGVTCDCRPAGTACTPGTCSSTCACVRDAEHLGDQLDDAGLSWRAYAESMGTPCNLWRTGSYAPRHVPFVYFQSMQDDPTRCADHVVDYSEFAADLAGDTPAFVFITPNLKSDMHDPYPGTATNLANGDAWLAARVPAILASDAYQDDGLLVIVWDEDDAGSHDTTDDAIPFIALSPLGKHGYDGNRRVDHYALLATIEDGLGLPRLGAAADADPLLELFSAP